MGHQTAIDFELWLRGQGYADRTVYEYCKWARRLARWCTLHGHDLPDLPPHVLRQWVDDTLAEGRDSRKQAYATCKHLYTMLGRDDEPWLAIRVPRKRDGTPDPFTDAEASQLRDGAVMVGGRAGLATLGLLYTAARPGEVAGWRWDGIDWDNATIRWWRPKVRDWHQVAVLPVLQVALEKARPPMAEGHMFVGNNGRPHVQRSTIWSWVRKVADTVGVDHVHPRRFRATAGSKVANATGDVQAAARLMGNSVEVAARYYTVVEDDRMRRAMGVLDAAW